MVSCVPTEHGCCLYVWDKLTVVTNLYIAANKVVNKTLRNICFIYTYILTLCYVI